MVATSSRALYALLLWGAQVQTPVLSFDGVSLGSDFAAVAARYPHSTAQDGYVSLAPEDVHNHISAIEVSGTGPTRRVRITFETRGARGQAEYPGARQSKRSWSADSAGPRRFAGSWRRPRRGPIASGALGRRS
jgi:hypothetical protein